MNYQQPSKSFSGFALLTPRLVLVPTPLAISIPSYVALYANLHADASFCDMGFGDKFPVVERTQEQMRDVIATRDIARCWEKRGMGDFAVGWRWKEHFNDATARPLGNSSEQVHIIDAKDVESACRTFDAIEWLGYAGVRDATTTSLPPPDASDNPLPPWEEMVELRYGVAPTHWGQGVAREAAEAVMQWATTEMGVKRFIAETESANSRSGRVLEKMGFRKSGTAYWKDEDEVEWERDATKSQ
jgi:RimJ/RimL family protein N-acetyltransferase